MKDIYIQLIDVGLGFLKQYLSSLTTAKAPQEVIDGVQASITALETHRSDVMSAADWEALRG